MAQHWLVNKQTLSISEALSGRSFIFDQYGRLKYEVTVGSRMKGDIENTQEAEKWRVVCILYILTITV